MKSCPLPCCYHLTHWTHLVMMMISCDIWFLFRHINVNLRISTSLMVSIIYMKSLEKLAYFEIFTLVYIHDIFVLKSYQKGNPYGVVANMLDCNIIVSKFKLKLCYYVHFWINTTAKSKLSCLSSYGLNSTTIVLLQGWFSIK